MRNPRAEGAGASIGLAGHREASTPIHGQPQFSAVDVFAPCGDAVERALRLRIYKARDVASASASRSKHSRARAQFMWAADLAHDTVFAPASIENLKEIIRVITRAFLNARLIEELGAPDEER